MVIYSIIFDWKKMENPEKPEKMEKPEKQTTGFSRTRISCLFNQKIGTRKTGKCWK